MSKSNVAEKFVVVPEEIIEVAAPAAVMTIVKEEPVEVRKLTLDEKIQKVEDLSLMIARCLNTLIQSSTDSGNLTGNEAD